MRMVDLIRQWEEILPAANALARDAGVLRGIARRLSVPEGYEALRRIERDLGRLGDLDLRTRDLRRDVGEIQAAVKEWLDSEWGRRASTVGKDIRSWFEERGTPLRRRGDLLYRFPAAIRIDARNDRAEILHAGEIVKDKVPLAPDRVFKEWEKARDLLERNATPPDSFAEDLRKAYGDHVRLRGLRPGRQVRLLDVHFCAFVRRQTAQVRQDPRRGRVKEYPRFQFAWDLGRMLEDPDVERDDLEFVVARPGTFDNRTACVKVDFEEDKETAYADLRCRSESSC